MSVLYHIPAGLLCGALADALRDDPRTTRAMEHLDHLPHPGPALSQAI